MPSIAAVQPLHVAAWIELQTQARSAPTVKQQLAAIRHLFDWLVMGQVVPLNPAASVRGPAHSAHHGKTPVLDPAEARTLLGSIDMTTPIGLRDRALIALMVYSFGRIGTALAMKVEDVFVQNRRLCVRPREKGGKRHEMPCAAPMYIVSNPALVIAQCRAGIAAAKSSISATIDSRDRSRRRVRTSSSSQSSGPSKPSTDSIGASPSRRSARGACSHSASSG